MNERLQNPYVGPRPFATNEKDIFFGREPEAENLIPLVIAERLVLFYAQSGAGKSSLVNARLIPGLQKRSFQVLPVGRVSGEVSSSDEVDNIFVYNLLIRLDQGRTPAERLAHQTIAGYLADLDVAGPEEAIPATVEPPAEAILDAPQIDGAVKPLALVIDQFEELFITRLDAWGQRKVFFEQIRQAMETDPYLWVVLVMREDYVAQIEPYAYLLPGRLRARFYMQRMGYSSALDAVQKPVENLRPFEPAVAEKLVNNLRLINVVETENQQSQYGEYIEPVQLQVVCYQLWENLRNQPGERITDSDLALLARGDDLAQFVNRALGDFYEKAIDGVLRDPSVKVSERTLREWFSKELITEEETRGSVFQGDKATGGLPNDVVRMLEARFMIRSETRASRKWYELTHDRFVGPILKANRDWNDRNPRPVLADAQAWDSGGRKPDRLYDGRRLDDTLKQLTSQPGEFSTLEREFLQAGDLARSHVRARRQQIFLGLVALVGLLILALVVALAYSQTIAARANQQVAEKQATLAGVEKKQALDARVQAEEARVQALQQRSEALALQQEAERQRAEAEKQRNEAEKQRNEAVNQKAIAESAQAQAEAARFASYSTYIQETNLNLSLLYALKALDRFAGGEARGALFNSLQQGLKSQIEQDGPPLNADSAIYQVTYSPDDSLIAAGLINGLKIWKNRTNMPLNALIGKVKTSLWIKSVSFDSKGELFAFGGEDRAVHIWNQVTGEVVNVSIPLPTVLPRIQQLAFQPGGKYLAIATEVSPITRIGYTFLYDTSQRAIVDQQKCGEFITWSIAWSPDGSLLAIGCGGRGVLGGSLRVVDVKTKETVLDVKAHTGGVRSIAWYPDSRRLISGGIDQKITRWDLDNPQNPAPLTTKHEDTPEVTRSLAISPDGRLLVSTNYPGNGFITWYARTLKQKDSYPFATQPAISIAFNTQGNRFAVASNDGSISIRTYVPVNPLNRLVFTTGGPGAAGAFLDAQDKLVIIQDQALQKAILFQEDTQKSHAITALHSSLGSGQMNNRPVILAGNKDGIIAFLDPATGSPARPPLQLAPSGEVHSPVISADGSLLAASVCSPACDKIIAWDLTSDARKFIIDLGTRATTASSLALSPDNKTLAIGTSEGGIAFYDLSTRAITETVTNVKLPTSSLSYSPAELNLLAAGFKDGEIGLWEASSRTPIGRFFERASSQVNGLLFRHSASNGAWSLVSVSAKGEVNEWIIDQKDWIARACQYLQTEISPEEKQRFLQELGGPYPCP